MSLPGTPQNGPAFGFFHHTTKNLPAQAADESGGGWKDFDLEVLMEAWLWYFWIYSFLGCLLERGYAAATRAPRRERKCFLLLPLCPVYGLGMLAVLALPESWRQGPALLAAGALAATSVEFAVHWAYETLLGVRFWDYSGLPGNLGGRVCLPFSIAWGALTTLTVWLVHPTIRRLAEAAPAAVTYGGLLLFTVDAVFSARFLRVTHDVEELRLTGWSL